MIASLYQSASCVNITGVLLVTLIMHCRPEMVRAWLSWRRNTRLGYNEPTLRIPNARQPPADLVSVLAFAFSRQCSTARHICNGAEICASERAESGSRARARN